MGFGNGGYEKLVSGEDKGALVERRRRRLVWLNRRGRGKAAGLRLKLWRSSRRKKLNWKPFCVMMFTVSRKIARKYVDFVKRMKKMQDEESSHPAILFSFQWGLPVLSHQTQSQRQRTISISHSTSTT